MKEILRRISRMRTVARCDGKYVPSVEQMLAAWPADMRCPKCKKLMVFSAKEDWHRCATLQHLKSDKQAGEFVICCMSCNATWRNLGDDVDLMNTDESLRKCRICNSLKEVDNFVLQKNGSGNMTRGSYCNECRKSRLRSYCLGYREENKDDRNESKRQSYADNREKELSRKRDYYLANKEIILAKARERKERKRSMATDPQPALRQ